MQLYKQTKYSTNQTELYLLVFVSFCTQAHRTNKPQRELNMFVKKNNTDT